MRAVVLVGGFGTRLRPLTERTPKQMLPVAGRPMIERVLAHLGSHGIEEAVLSLGYRPEEFTAAYPHGRCAGVAVRYAVEPMPMGTGGAIRFAADSAGVYERLLVVNGDVLCRFDLGALVAAHEAVGAEATLSLIRVADPSAFGIVRTAPDGRVLEFVEKPPADRAPGNLASAGHYVMEPSVLERIEPGRAVNVEREVFPAIAASGRLHARPYDDYWLDVGTPERYLQASLDVLDGILGVAVDPPGTAVVDGEVVAPCLLSNDVVVAAGAVVRRCVVGPGCRVEAGARVEDSVLLAHSVVGPRAVVRSSVLGTGAVVVGGATAEGLVVGPSEHLSPSDADGRRATQVRGAGAGSRR